MKSMTGFGKASFEGEFYRIHLEMRSVNSRYLDLNFRMPRMLHAQEELLRRHIGASLSRGKVDLYIDFSLVSGKGSELTFDAEYLDQLVPLMERMMKRYDLDGSIDLSHLLQKDVLQVKEVNLQETALSEDLLQVLQEALEQLMAMRLREGEHLKKVLQGHLDQLREIHEGLTEMAPRLLDHYRSEFRRRLQELLGERHELDEHRLEMEMAILSDKKDVQEEMSRIASHLAQAYALLEKDEPIGRALDFLAQEFNREINTMGSKSAGYEITEQVLMMKNVLEQFREQVQNVE